MPKISLDQKNAKDDENEWRGAVADASSAASGGAVPSEVSSVSISSMQLASKKERQKCPSTHSTSGIKRAKDWSPRWMSLWRPTVWRLGEK